MGWFINVQKTTSTSLAQLPAQNMTLGQLSLVWILFFCFISLIQIKILNQHLASSINLQKGFANLICAGDLQSGSNIFGLPTIIKITLALETATFNLFGLYKNSIPLGASSGDELAKL